VVFAVWAGVVPVGPVVATPRVPFVVVVAASDGALPIVEPDVPAAGFWAALVPVEPGVVCAALLELVCARTGEAAKVAANAMVVTRRSVIC
jgi:hypothetical protein